MHRLGALAKGSWAKFLPPEGRREAAEFAPVGLAPHGETRAAANRSAPLPATSRAILASLTHPLVPRSPALAARYARL